MTVHVSCPKCHASLEPHGVEAMPSFCPSCRARIACPRCGRLLQGDPEEPTHFRCPDCHLTMIGKETALDDRPRSQAGGTIEVPGFELKGELGRGGMGIVYRARQLSLQREVAIKVLPPALAADPLRLDRFRNEASVAAGLVDSHIVPVYDIQEVQGVPILVMPLIEGVDLAKIIHDRLAVRKGQPPSQPHPWALLDDRAYLHHVFPLLDQMVDAVTVIHQAGVLHRDLKPSNALVDGHGNLWLTDFGLARLELKGAGTSPGQAMGTPGYMAPEQARGVEDIDFRADLFSLGATLYKALTLELPYGERGEKGGQTPPVPPSKRQPLLSRDFDAVLLKALEWERQDRYGSAQEFQDDWRRVRQGLLPKARRMGRPQRLARWTRRHPKEVGGLLAIGVLLAVVGFFATRGTPDNTIYRTVHLDIEPPPEKLVLVPLDDETGFPNEQKIIRPRIKTLPDIPRCPVGEYLVVVLWPDKRFHEVYRVVPRPGEARPYAHGLGTDYGDGIVNLPKIAAPPEDVLKDMVKFPGGRFTVGNKELALPLHDREIGPFFLDRMEVTVKNYRLANELPAAIINNPPPDDYPITMVTFDKALDYAEKVGKRLPDEAEYEFAATNGGRTAYPWGDDPNQINDWQFGPVGQPFFDRTNTEPSVYGLYSNVIEWTLSRHFPYPGASPMAIDRFRKDRQDARVVRGGHFAIAKGTPGSDLKVLRQGPRQREAISHHQALPGLGFRCARSAEPRFLKD